ncbi:hypothetical protein CL65_gp064 [Mycobacterium phage Patience]|uniref:Uncharacterized protein n=1 Tax=Mycobacterium phage Patience TaxID=1074308 RepID=G1JWH4_9CAUD|nr:hypothetical protein CL65_gp064 [Mycobacterium phage Patience]AEL97972.1 hypothetical protein PATIENCE_63 [Mycobacterium phage Patience]
MDSVIESMLIGAVAGYVVAKFEIWRYEHAELVHRILWGIQ